MYKIYINEVELILTSAADYNKHFRQQRAGNRAQMECSFQSKADFLFLIETLEKARDLQTVLVIGREVETMFENFSFHYQKVEAAGGLVRNAKEEWLLMYRLGKWDLPKGKVEKAETHLRAALREVEEETGLQPLRARSAIRFAPYRQHATLHTYRLQEQRILKYTYWFRMDYRGSDNGRPQLEEGITRLEWAAPDRLGKYLRNTYGTIRDVLLQQG